MPSPSPSTSSSQIAAGSASLLIRALMLVFWRRPASDTRVKQPTNLLRSSVCLTRTTDTKLQEPQKTKRYCYGDRQWNLTRHSHPSQLPSSFPRGSLHIRAKRAATPASSPQITDRTQRQPPPSQSAAPPPATPPPSRSQRTFDNSPSSHGGPKPPAKHTFRALVSVFHGLAGSRAGLPHRSKSEICTPSSVSASYMSNCSVSGSFSRIHSIGWAVTSLN